MQYASLAKYGCLCSDMPELQQCNESNKYQDSLEEEEEENSGSSV